ncbi:hypothetical protein, partial [Sphingobacterium sp. T2]|uniref:hypothetical protein n=1 Tax=Sphingobacterium sp. T2 TaxID=1590596 RepID=UPI001E55460F
LLQTESIQIAIPQIHFTNSQYNNATSTRFLFNNSYFVIKNIALGYRLPYTYINKTRAFESKYFVDRRKSSYIFG